MLASPPAGWRAWRNSTRHSLLKKTDGHIGLIQLGIRQIEGELVFTISTQVLSRALAEAEGIPFRPEPVADTGRWHWLADMAYLSGRTIGPYLALPTAGNVDAPAIIREIVDGVLVPPCEAHMDDHLLLEEWKSRLTPPLQLGNYHPTRRTGLLAAALGDTTTAMKCVAMFDDALRSGGVPPVPHSRIQMDRDALLATCS